MAKMAAKVFIVCGLCAEASYIIIGFVPQLVKAKFLETEYPYLLNPKPGHDLSRFWRLTERESASGRGITGANAACCNVGRRRNDRGCDILATASNGRSPDGSGNRCAEPERRSDVSEDYSDKQSRGHALGCVVNHEPGLLGPSQRRRPTELP